MRFNMSNRLNILVFLVSAGGLVGLLNCGGSDDGTKTGSGAGSGSGSSGSGAGSGSGSGSVGDKRIDAAWHKNSDNLLVLLRGTKAYFFDYDDKTWGQPADLATPTWWKVKNGPFEASTEAVDAAWYADAKDELLVLRGTTAYIFHYTNASWDTPVDLRPATAWGAEHAPFANGNTQSLDVTWHLETDIVGLVRGTTAFVYHGSGASKGWDPNNPIDLLGETSTWRATNGPFEKSSQPLDAAWHTDKDNTAWFIRGSLTYIYDYKEPDTTKRWKTPVDVATGWSSANAPFSE